MVSALIWILIAVAAVIVIYGIYVFNALISLKNRIEINIGTFSICVSQLEMQIAFKEMVLKSPKDLDDALHIRDVAKEYLDDKLIEKYKVMLNEFY